MKFIIITINDKTNYGNILQNYALTKMLERHGTVCTADCEAHISGKFKQRLLPVLKIARLFKVFLKNVYSKHFYSVNKRQTRINSFIKKNNLSLKYTVTCLRGIRPLIDSSFTVVVGSDQVWNYSGMPKNSFSLRLGSFVPQNVNIVSYAASFGIANVSGEFKPIFQRYLPRFKAISVREDRGKELVKEISGLKATVVLDPTLMLDTRLWDKITCGFVSNDDRYVLTYFLGKPSDKQERTIQEYAKQHGYRVRRILDIRDKQTYTAGPQDFVELFSKARYVFTDSYHACCFSILYHKQFTVFNRAGMEGKVNMNSRMETLFRLFDLDSVVMDNGLAPQIDYQKVGRLLDQRRAESQAWLDNALMEE